MADICRCTLCDNLLSSDAIDGTCPTCTLRAGLEPDSGPTGAREGKDVTIDHEPVQPGHVLDSLTEMIGTVPRVLLADTSPDETAVVVPGARSDERPAPTERGNRYELFGEIARGGMGVVLKGRDLDLGRDLAVKVLLESHENKPEMLRRFVEEAQIGGQLQHPGIVPVHELGMFADRRLYFTMKLVKGRTLSALLAERQSPAHDLPRFLSIFEGMCQTMAYSHARGVIHRDLKPSNVMVGSFGEVQVMDWGLAKVILKGGVADEPQIHSTPEGTLIATLRSESNLDESRVGSILGTPAYMAPEQARGETDRIDERADVFALGSILCEILAGTPAFTGRGVTDVLRRAATGDTSDALARLDVCGAEAELISLVKKCLAVERDDRPRDANVLAERVTSYLAGVQERVQAAERERAVAMAKAVEERRRRKVQLALAASVLALVTLGGLSTSYYLQQQARRVTAGQRVIDKVTTLQGQALLHPEEIQRWEIALAAVEQADPSADPKTKAQLVALGTDIQAGLDAAKRDQKLLDRLIEVRLAEADDQNGESTDAAYTDAFREAGIDLVSLPSAEAGAKIKARPPSVALALAEALDDWLVTRHSKRTDAAGAKKLADAARIADTDPWRNKLRDALIQADKATRLAELQLLAESAKSEERAAISLQLLGSSLITVGENTLAESVLRRANQRNPRDLWVNYTLGRALAKRSRFDEAIRFFTAARALRPESAHELAHALERLGKSDEALEVFRDLKRLRPGNARNLVCMGTALHEKGLSQEADETNRAAVLAGREETRRHPDDALAHNNLGIALKNLGQLDEAIAEGRTAIRLNPDLVQAHCLLGTALQGQAKFDEAVVEYRTAIRLDPNDAASHGALGHVLQNTGAVDESITECQTAIRLHPGHAEYHFNLGHAFMLQSKAEEAAAALREAIRLSPDYAEALCNLAVVLGHQGDFAGAVEMLRKGHRVGSARPDWRYPSAQWLAEAERKLAESRGALLTPAKPKADSMPDAEKLASLHKRGHELAASKPSEAEPLFRQALEGYRKTEGPDGPLTIDLTIDLANLLFQTGRGADADPMFRAGLEQARKRFGPEDPRTTGILAAFGMNLLQLGKMAEAEPVLRDCLALREKAQPDQWSTFNTRSVLGGSLMGQKKYAEAEPLILSGYEGMKAREDKIPPPGKPRLAEAGERVIKLYEDWGKPDKVAEWRTKLAKPADEPKKQP